MTEPEILLDGRVTLHCGDCIEILRSMPANSIDSAAIDPPYHLASIVKRFGKKNSAAAKSRGKTGVYRRSSAGFMGKEWDGGDIAFRPETWKEVLRVLKPGAHLIAFGAPKNGHWVTGAIEIAGFEIRDRLIELIALDPLVMRFLESLNEAQRDAFLRLLDESSFSGELQWIFGSGFPKGKNIAKAIDKHLGKAGEIVPAGNPVRRIRPGADQHRDGSWEKLADRIYQPGHYIPATDEAAIYDGYDVALKPAYEPIVLARKPVQGSNAENVLRFGTGGINVEGCKVPGDDGAEARARHGGGVAGNGTSYELPDSQSLSTPGRWPANVLHDGSEDATGDFPSEAKAGGPVSGDAPSSVHNAVYGERRRVSSGASYGDSGSASRFFYSAKADAEDRLGSRHPTVKPLALMQYLVRLITPPGGTVLDCFAGTGTTGEAAFREGFKAVLVEREAEYQDDIRRRMELANAGTKSRRRAANKRRVDQSLDDLPIFSRGATK